jgi:hypothetical protein
MERRDSNFRGEGLNRTMSDRGLLFLFSVLMVAAGVGAAAWLVATGQAGTVDGLFLVLVALLTAAAFALYLVFLVRHAMEKPVKPAAKAVSAAGKSAQVADAS